MPLAVLADTPDWHGAATELVHSLVALETRDERVRLLDKVCQRLEAGLYPAFLQILFTIERCGDADARAIVSDTVAYAVSTGRVPSGKVNAWGASHNLSASAFGQTRQLGPIEYLCAWYTQPAGLSPLTRQAFAAALSSLIALFAASEPGILLYRDRLREVSQDPLHGTLSGQTRAGLRALADTLAPDCDPGRAVEAFLAGIQAGQTLGSIQRNPFT